MVRKSGGWAGRILHVDLTSGMTWCEPSISYGQQYIGGRGIAARIAWEEIPPGVGPFDPENRLVFAVGPLTGTSAPNSGRTTICSLSPQAYPYEWFSHSSIGGYWGPTLKYAGYDAVVVKGQASQPVYLWIDDDHVELRDASHLWGRGTFATQDELIAAHGRDVRVLACGPAGENRSRIAIVATGTGSAAGQCGFGGVMGAKRLKALAVRGTKGIPIANPDAFSECTLQIAREAHAANSCIREPFLDPERVAEYGQRFFACTQQCATASLCHDCRYYRKVPGVLYPERDYSGIVVCESGIFAGATNSFYGWKTGFQAGFELAQISQDYGLNHWELGIGLAPWLRACHNEGYLKSLDGEPFDLDNPATWDTLFRKISLREGLGDALAEGGVRAAEILGMGQDLIPQFYTAWGFAGHWDGRADRTNVIVYPYWLVTALQWAMSTRDPMGSGHAYAQNVMRWSPLSNPEGDGLDWDELADLGARVWRTREAAHPQSGYEGKAYPAVWDGHRSVMKDSLTVDDQLYPRIFSMKTKDHWARAGDMEGPDFEYHMFRLATGMEIGRDAFELMAERVFNLERALQVRNWGRTRRTDEQVVASFEQIENWVNPFLGESKGLNPERFARMLDEYYALRGWDAGTGRPTWNTLRRLGLRDVAVDLAECGLI